MLASIQTHKKIYANRRAEKNVQYEYIVLTAISTIFYGVA